MRNIVRGPVDDFTGWLFFLSDFVGGFSSSEIYRDNRVKQS